MYDKYTIQKDDTLYSIANKFNTLEETIKDINNIPFNDSLREGTEIIVPKKTREYFEYYTIEKGDNLYAISKRYNVNPELLASVNGLNEHDYIYPNQEILIPKSGYSYYITNEGDTLEMVSSKFKTNKNKLVETNELIYLLPGQLLVNKII